MSKIKKNRKFDLNPVSLAAVFISLCALFLSIYQTQLSKQQAYSSVLPHLRVYSASEVNDNSFQWSLMVSNDGVGPAIIRSVDYKYNGRLLSNLQEAMDSLYVGLDAMGAVELSGASNDLITTGAFIPAGERIEWLQTGRNLAFRDLFTERMKKMQVTIRYASVYGQHWEVCFNCPDNSLNNKF